jgi:hypothetical protein
MILGKTHICRRHTGPASRRGFAEDWISEFEEYGSWSQTEIIQRIGRTVVPAIRMIEIRFSAISESVWATSTCLSVSGSYIEESLATTFIVSTTRNLLSIQTV